MRRWEFLPSARLPIWKIRGGIVLKAKKRCGREEITTRSIVSGASSSLPFLSLSLSPPFLFNKWSFSLRPRRPRRWESRCHRAYRDYRSERRIDTRKHIVRSIAVRYKEGMGGQHWWKENSASPILFARWTRGYKVREDSIVGLIMRNAWDVHEDAFVCCTNEREEKEDSQRIQLSSLHWEFTDVSAIIALLRGFHVRRIKCWMPAASRRNEKDN